MTNLNSTLKSRDITLPTKVHLLKAIVFPVVMHGCESWTIKEAECQRIDGFELWCWRRLLRVPWRSNECILKEISSECSLEGQMFFFFFFFLVFFFFSLNFILFNFTILYWFCHISKWICHRYTCVPHPEPTSLFPPHTIPLGRPSAPAPSIQYHASNLDWWQMFLKLKLQYFGHLWRRIDSFEKTLMLRKI